MKKDNKATRPSAKVIGTRILAIVLALLMVGSVAAIVISLFFSAV